MSDIRKFVIPDSDEEFEDSVIADSDKEIEDIVLENSINEIDTLKNRKFNQYSSQKFLSFSLNKLKKNSDNKGNLISSGINIIPESESDESLSNSGNSEVIDETENSDLKILNCSEDKSDEDEIDENKDIEDANRSENNETVEIEGMKFNLSEYRNPEDSDSDDSIVLMGPKSRKTINIIPDSEDESYLDEESSLNVVSESNFLQTDKNKGQQISKNDNSKMQALKFISSDEDECGEDRAGTVQKNNAQFIQSISKQKRVLKVISSDESNMTGSDLEDSNSFDNSHKVNFNSLKFQSSTERRDKVNDEKIPKNESTNFSKTSLPLYSPEISVNYSTQIERKKELTYLLTGNKKEDCSGSLRSENDNAEDYSSSLLSESSGYVCSGTEPDSSFRSSGVVDSYEINNDSRNTSTAKNNLSLNSTNDKSVNESQKYANLSKSEIEKKILENKKILRRVNINSLPDKGAKLKNAVQDLETVLSNLRIEDNTTDCKMVENSRNCDNIVDNSNIEPYKLVGKPNIVPQVPSGSKQLSQLELEKLYQNKIDYAARDYGGKISEDCKMVKNSKNCDKYVDNSNIAPHKLVGKPNIVPQVPGGSKQLSQRELEKLYQNKIDYAARDYGGKISEEKAFAINRSMEKAVKILHDTLKSKPDVEVDEDQGPAGLNVELLPHQKRALKWALWRESQMPPGGILADDMGLCKTLTMISLIMKCTQLIESGDIKCDFNSKQEESSWLSRDKMNCLKPSKGTLIVCPAALLGHWENEAKKWIKSSHSLSVLIYHGSARKISTSRLSHFDMVITSYTIVGNEAFSGKTLTNKKIKDEDDLPDIAMQDQGLLFRVGWARIILDEAHVIRNHKTKSAQGCCMLRGGRRWTLSGTPIQNKEADFFSLIRFLRVAPFDQYIAWKTRVATAGTAGQQRIDLLVKAYVLRRTKSQTDKVTGKAMVDLPNREYIEHRITLDEEEQKVYDRVFDFSKNSMLNYMKSQEEKTLEMRNRTKLPSCYTTTSTNNSGQSNNKENFSLAKGMGEGKEVKVHHILVLILRLRQICCHPSLIRKIIEIEPQVDGIKTEDGDELKELDLISQMGAMNLKEGVEDSEIDNSIKDDILTDSNPIFKKKRISSKIWTIMDELKKIWDNNPQEKAVIVSQWTSMLAIVYKHLKKNDIESTAITGTVPVPERTGIVNDFNNNPRGAKVMLLSLVAGGVGLNLVGGNHLFVIDPHWNPQLESQACDRIYRVGQKKDVKIHRFLVENTVEEKIIQLQQKKLELADSILQGSKKGAPYKLTLDDIKNFFSIDNKTKKK